MRIFTNIPFLRISHAAMVLGCFMHSVHNTHCMSNRVIPLDYKELSRSAQGTSSVGFVTTPFTTQENAILVQVPTHRNHAAAPSVSTKSQITFISPATPGTPLPPKLYCWQTDNRTLSVEDLKNRDKMFIFAGISENGFFPGAIKFAYDKRTHSYVSREELLNRPDLQTPMAWNPDKRPWSFIDRILRLHAPLIRNNSSEPAVHNGAQRTSNNHIPARYTQEARNHDTRDQQRPVNRTQYPPSLAVQKSSPAPRVTQRYHSSDSDSDNEHQPRLVALSRRTAQDRPCIAESSSSSSASSSRSQKPATKSRPTRVESSSESEDEVRQSRNRQQPSQSSKSTKKAPQKKSAPKALAPRRNRDESSSQKSEHSDSSEQEELTSRVRNMTARPTREAPAQLRRQAPVMNMVPDEDHPLRQFAHPRNGKPIPSKTRSKSPDLATVRDLVQDLTEIALIKDCDEQGKCSVCLNSWMDLAQTAASQDKVEYGIKMCKDKGDNHISHFLCTDCFEPTRASQGDDLQCPVCKEFASPEVQTLDVAKAIRKLRSAGTAD